MCVMGLVLADCAWLAFAVPGVLGDLGTRRFVTAECSLTPSMGGDLGDAMGEGP